MLRKVQRTLVNRIPKLFRGWAMFPRSDSVHFICPRGHSLVFKDAEMIDDVPDLIDTLITHAWECDGSTLDYSHERSQE